MEIKQQVERLKKQIEEKMAEYKKLLELLHKPWLEEGKDIMVKIYHPVNKSEPYRTKVIAIEQKTNFGLSIYIRPTKNNGFWISEKECYPLDWDFNLIF